MKADTAEMWKVEENRLVSEAPNKHMLLLNYTMYTAMLKLAPANFVERRFWDIAVALSLKERNIEEIRIYQFDPSTDIAWWAEKELIILERIA